MLAVEVVGEIEAACVRAGLRPPEWGLSVMGSCPCGCGLRGVLLAHLATTQVAQVRFKTVSELRDGLEEWLARVTRATAAAAVAPAKPACRHGRLH